MRIVHVETGTHLYGGARQVLYLLEGLASRDVASLLVAPRGSAVAAAAEERGLAVHALPVRGEADLVFLARLTRLLRRRRPDVVHLHSRRGADTLGALAAAAAGVPAVVSRRVDNPEPGWLVGPKYRMYARVITISEAIAEVLRGQGVERIRCVRSAVDPAAFQVRCDPGWFRSTFDLPAQAPVVGMGAQFIARKGHAVLLDAVPRVLSDHPRTRFLLFGRGPLLETVRAGVEDRGLGRSVLLPGFRSDFDRILPCLDVLVHPASREGLGVVLLQAAAAGVPAVAGRAGGIPEIVRDGENGFTVEPLDALALADRLVRLLGDDALRQRMGDAGRRIARRDFSLDRMVEGNLAVYREVISDRGSR